MSIPLSCKALRLRAALPIIADAVPAVAPTIAGKKPHGVVGLLLKSAVVPAPVAAAVKDSMTERFLCSSNKCGFSR